MVGVKLVNLKQAFTVLMTRKRVTPSLEEADEHEENHGWTARGATKGNDNAWRGEDGMNEGGDGDEDGDESEDVLSSKRASNIVRDEGYSTASEELEDSGEEGAAHQEFPVAGSTERELQAWTHSEIAEASLLPPLARTDGQAKAAKEDDDEEDEDEDGTIPIEPFNMDAELAEGHIDEVTGGYVRTKRDGEGKGDLGDMSEQELGLTGLSREARAKTRRAAAERRLREELQTATIPSLAGNSRRALVEQVLPQLALGETPAEALARRRPPPRRPLPHRGAGGQSNPLTNGGDRRAETTAVEAELQRKQEIEIITDACTTLLTMGLLDVYQMTREELARIN